MANLIFAIQDLETLCLNRAVASPPVVTLVNRRMKRWRRTADIQCRGTTHLISNQVQAQAVEGATTAAVGFRSRLRAFRPDKTTVLELTERVLVTLIFAHFAHAMLTAYHDQPSVGIVLLVISEVLVIGLVLTRGLSKTMSDNPLDWLLAFAGSSAPLLAVPAIENPVIPANICLILMITGMCIQISAKVVLWRSFGLVAANRGVKVDGPYRFVRHPMYAGYVLTHIGFLLGFPSVQNSILYLAALAIQVARLNREERILRQDPVYQEFASRVRYRLLPGLF